ncbi:hypothetical protein V2J09_015662 [Rumex salicifolius]
MPRGMQVVDEGSTDRSHFFNAHETRWRLDLLIRFSQLMNWSFPPRSKFPSEEHAHVIAMQSSNDDVSFPVINVRQRRSVFLLLVH